MRRPGRSMVLAVALLTLGACGSSKKRQGELHVPSPAWEDQVIYFVMTDRFANGDPSNDDQQRGEWDPADPAKYSGGDLQGVIDRLDYIQGLGATAVWITPPVANMWWDPLQQSGGYHGYWARHLEKVDEHLGTLATYQALSRALHGRGMYLVQDVVPNHMGNFFTYCSDPSGLGCAPASYDPTDVTRNFVLNVNAVPSARPEQAPFDQDDARDPAQRAAAIYHWTPVISDYNDPTQELTYQVSDLDDLNSENPVVRKALRDSYAYWIREVGVDAFRVDTVKYVPHDFWNDFFHSTDVASPGILAAARATGRDDFLAFGEVYETPEPLDDAADRKVASYLGTADAPELPSVLQFPLYTEIGRVFASGKPTSYMTYRLGRLMDRTLYPNPNVLPTFIDNHDVARFLSQSSAKGLAQALAFVFTIPGIPVVYYGTEQGFTETRAAMFKGGYLAAQDRFDTSSEGYQRLRKLAELRRSSKVFTRGDLQVLLDNPSGPGALVYRRTLGTETALVLMNTAEENVLVAGLDTGLPAGSVLSVVHEEQDPPAPVVGEGGKLTIVLPPRAVLVARPTGEVKAPPAPAAAITVVNPIDGQTLSTDVTLTGSVTPPTTKLKLVIDGYLDQAKDVTVTTDGTWYVIMPVSSFPDGRLDHTATIYAPAAQVATPPMRFTSDVVFVGITYLYSDPAGDDDGPSHTYTYPQDVSFTGHHYGDVTGVEVDVGATTMRLKITMADWSTLWKPTYGFDHVCFDVFFSIPGRTGLTAMPKLQASVPAGFGWSFDQFSYGWGTTMYSSDGATATEYGAVARAPSVSASAATRTVTFIYDRTAFGLSTWSGVGIYVSTWDFDGIGATFRPISPTGGQWTFGGGPETAPLIMDDLAPMLIP